MSMPEDPTAIPQFKFLRYCPAKHDVAMGDARLSLEREQPENFDVLAVDAFSSDSIPVHLLTFEAMKLFFHHLKPDGILAVHISNRYLDLEPVVKGESDQLGKTARTVDTDDNNSQDVFAATWVLVTHATLPVRPVDRGRLQTRRSHPQSEALDRRLQQPVPDSEIGRRKAKKTDGPAETAGAPVRPTRRVAAPPAYDLAPVCGLAKRFSKCAFTSTSPGW